MHRPCVITGTRKTVLGGPQSFLLLPLLTALLGTRVASALGALGGRLLGSSRPPVPAHVPVLVHVRLHQVAHLHGVDLPALTVADLGGGGGTITQTSFHTQTFSGQ